MLGMSKRTEKMTVQKNEKGEEQMKKLLENKSYGFYVTFVSVVASIVCAAVYASM